MPLFIIKFPVSSEVQIFCTECVLVDIADEMLNIASKRFAHTDNVSYEILDYFDGIPKGDFDTIISALAIHHLENTDKIKLFERIYDKLPDGGLFVNYDQFCAGQVGYIFIKTGRNRIVE